MGAWRGALTVAGEGEGLPQAVTHHGHLQADAVAQLLGAEVDGAPHQAGEGIILGAVAGPQAVEAGTGQGCCPAVGVSPPTKKRLFGGISQRDAPASGYSHVQHVAESGHLLIPLLRHFEELVAVGKGVRPGGDLWGRARAHQLLWHPGGYSPPPARDGGCRAPGRAPGTESLCWPRPGDTQLCGGTGTSRAGVWVRGHLLQDTSPTSAPSAQL